MKLDAALAKTGEYEDGVYKAVWGIGRGEDLAKGLRAALAATPSAK